jgi:hypothetical protein
MNTPHRLASLFCALVIPAAAHAVPADDLFRDAAIAPADVRVFVHLEDAAAMRAEVADRPIARFIHDAIGSGQLEKAWRSLADAAGMESAELFDVCFGRDVTLMIRGDGEAAQWALLSKMDADHSRMLVKNLRAVVETPREGAAIYAVPEQDLIVARTETRLLIGPKDHAELFHAVIPNLRRAVEQPLAAAEQPLADHPAITKARGLGGGCAGVYFRHGEPMGGWSVAVIALEGETMSLRHAAKFEHAPFTTPVTNLTWDLSPLGIFDKRAIIAMMEPTDIGGGRLESFALATLGEALISPELRANLGDSKMILIGAKDGRLENPRVEASIPTIARCYEVKDPQQALAQFDAQIVRVTRAINHLQQGEFLVVVPDEAAFRAGGLRHIDLKPAAEKYFEGLPIMHNISINWAVAKGPNGDWIVVDSDPTQLKEIVATMESEPARAPELCRSNSCGLINGEPLSRELHNLTDQAGMFVDPENVPEFRRTMRMLADLSGGIADCRWRLDRPSEQEMELEITMTLAPPESIRVTPPPPPQKSSSSPSPGGKRPARPSRARPPE